MYRSIKIADLQMLSKKNGTAASLISSANTIFVASLSLMQIDDILSKVESVDQIINGTQPVGVSKRVAASAATDKHPLLLGSTVSETFFQEPTQVFSDISILYDAETHTILFESLEDTDASTAGIKSNVSFVLSSGKTITINAGNSDNSIEIRLDPSTGRLHVTANNGVMVNERLVPVLNNESRLPWRNMPTDAAKLEEYTSKESFPDIGESGKLYIDLYNNRVYRWNDSDSKYVSIFNQTAQSSVFSGSQEEYEIAYAAGLIPNGTLVAIMDDEEGDDITTTSILGQAILGQMILG